MDRKIILCVLVAIALLGCKENNWLSWKVQNELWLEHNKTLDSVEVLSSGLQFKIISDPTPLDAQPNKTSTILCDYKVSLINGYVIEYQGPTFGGEQSVSLDLSSTIPGFAEGCHHIHNNGDIEIYIPAYLGYDYSKYVNNEYYDAEGYGTEGTQSYIPPYSTLIYKVHICAVSGN